MNRHESCLATKSLFQTSLYLFIYSSTIQMHECTPHVKGMLSVVYEVQVWLLSIPIYVPV